MTSATSELTSTRPPVRPPVKTPVTPPVTRLAIRRARLKAAGAAQNHPIALRRPGACRTAGHSLQSQGTDTLCA